MQLYVFPPSPNAMKVMSLANYLKADVEFVNVDLTKGEQQSESFLALNPNGKMPVLVDGDFVLWESNAILQYLADSAGSDLYPDSPQARADIARWLFWQTAHLGPAIGKVFFEILIRQGMMGEQPDAAAVEAGMNEFRQHAACLERQLDGRAFVTGELSVADFAIGAWLTYADATALPLSEFPRISTWYHDHVAALPGWQSAA